MDYDHSTLVDKLTKYKRHHYIPKFYLKRFASDERKKMINVFHVPTSRYFQGVSLRDQCYKNFYYDIDKTDSLDPVISMIEDQAAPVLSKIDSDLCVPSRESEQFSSLLYFVLLMRSRTNRAQHSMDEMTDSLGKMVLSRVPSVANDLDKFRISLKHGILLSIAFSISNVILFADLDCRILVNNSTIEFLTSDHPVVFYNRLMEKRRAFGSHCGIASRGLQVFFPISPKTCLLMFDSDTYIVNEINGASISISSEYDVWGLNRLQFISAHEKVFVRNGFHDVNLAKYANYSKRFRKGRLTRFAEIESTDNPNTTLSMVSDVNPNCSFEPSFIRVKKTAMEMPLSPKVAQLRNEALCRKKNQFDEMVAQGTLRADQLKEFLDGRFG
jgi:Protein of unknown function (DUF4238)